MPEQFGSTSTPDKYYTAYEAYLAEFNNYWSNAILYNTLSGLSYLFQCVRRNPEDPATEAAWTTAKAAYSQTDLGQYANYLTLYDVYVQSYNSYSGSVPLVGTMPMAPLPPPEVSSPIVPPTAEINAPNVAASADNAAPIAAMNLASEASSSSYRIVAGANTQSANPLAINLGSGGDVTLDGHTGLSLAVGHPTLSSPFQRSCVPVRGSIDIAAAGDFALLDQTAPGVVYTAGTIPAAPANDAGSLGIRRRCVQIGSQFPHWREHDPDIGS